jgi:hypothetical protein
MRSLSKVHIQVTIQHTKPLARDHGLNRGGDAIVIRLQGGSETASGGIRQTDAEQPRTGGASVGDPPKNARLHCRMSHR